ncbi:putative pectinesterase 10 [Phaseolus vulgaris]|uniref:putative pectinesterase 10 n=1 Tax=Phaseolus vulgaris TaxID=3885 RepID=UPI0035CAF190
MKSFHHPMTFFLVLVTCSFFCLGKAIDCGGKDISNTITVNPNGKKAFTTIQDAINSVKSNNDKWVKIYIKAGLYKERPQIPIEKPCIILQGEGSQNTIVSFSAHNGTSDSATFTSSPPNVIVTGITFKNLYTDSPALAARIYGDKSFIYNCSFMGYQDTLFDASGRHYIKNCYIEGEIDFIFGNAQSYYENCEIKAIGRNPNLPGFVTAQGRSSPDQPGGFVFEGGSIKGNGKVNLGRAWRPYARVIFHKTYFDSVVTPQGWVAWTASGNENRVTYAEVDCEGPGADSSKRVSWIKKLSSSDLEKLSFPVFINNDGWFDSLPTIS